MTAPDLTPEELREALAVAAENERFQREKADRATATVYQFHYALKDAGWHPGRTDDNLCDIIREKGKELERLRAQVATAPQPINIRCSTCDKPATTIGGVFPSCQCGGKSFNGTIFSSAAPAQQARPYWVKCDGGATCQPHATECPRCKNDIAKCDGAFRPAPSLTVGERPAWGWAIVDKNGDELLTRPRLREFFGAANHKHPPFTDQELANADKEWPGLAPFSIVTLYTAPPSQPAAQGAAFPDAHALAVLWNQAEAAWNAQTGAYPEPWEHFAELLRTALAQAQTTKEQL